MGKTFYYPKNLSLRKIFPEHNPFNILPKLTQLKDTLNVIGISHYHVLGGFVQFYLPGEQHILTYIPDTLLNSNKLNKFGRQSFQKANK